jgi:HTH-type transcriptional regulator/antitoxin HigA
MTSATYQNKTEVNGLLQEAIKHWNYVSPILKHPHNERDYKKLVSWLDALLNLANGNENHKLASLIDIISDLISAYEEEHYPGPEIKGIDALKYLMQEHNIKQSDLPEIGSQGVVSEILSGKRQLSIRQIKLLGQRFSVDPSTFLD